MTSDDENEDETHEELLEHRFRLRPDVVVAIELPSDLTAAEAERLSNFITKPSVLIYLMPLW